MKRALLAKEQLYQLLRMLPYRPSRECWIRTSKRPPETLIPWLGYKNFCKELLSLIRARGALASRGQSPGRPYSNKIEPFCCQNYQLCSLNPEVESPFLRVLLSRSISHRFKPLTLSAPLVQRATQLRKQVNKTYQGNLLSAICQNFASVGQSQTE